MPRPQPTRNAALAGRPRAGRARPLQTAKKPEGPLSPSGIFNILLPLFLLPRLCQMPHRQNGMVEQHPRTAPAHDLADALPHLGLVAVRLADTAERFGRYMRGSGPPARRRSPAGPRSRGRAGHWAYRDGRGSIAQSIRPTVAVFPVGRFFSGGSGTPPPTVFVTAISSSSRFPQSTSCQQFASSRRGGIQASRSCWPAPRPDCAR